VGAVFQTAEYNPSVGCKMDLVCSSQHFKKAEEEEK
jgi:hypothetical protein